MASKRRNPVGRAGNYVAPIDTVGMDDSMKSSLFGTNLNKVESDYVKQTGRPSALEAVRRARKANRMPPIKE